MSLINKAKKNIEKSDASGNKIFNTPYTVDSKLIELEIYASGERWITVVVCIADNN